MRGSIRCSALWVCVLLGCDGVSGGTLSSSGGYAGFGGDGAAHQGGATVAGGVAGAGAAQPTAGLVNAPRGGSRLKARIAEAEGGATQFLGWQDTQLDVACDFQPSLTGSLSCIPNGDDLAWVAGAEDSLFGDTRCSTPVRELQFGSVRCSAPRFAGAWVGGVEANRCQTEPSYFRVGNAVSQVYLKVGGACERVAYPAPANSISQGFFEVEPMALDEFVAGTWRDGVAADGIQPRYVTTADGAEAFWGFRDAEQGFDCQLATLTEGVRCVPRDMPLVTGSNFVDDTCQVPAAMALSCLQQDEAPYVVIDAVQSGDEQVWQIAEGGSRLDTSYAGTATAGGCLEFDNDEGVFAIGDEVTGSRFASGASESRTDEQGLTASLQQVGGWSAFSGSPLRNTDFDGYACSLFPAADGVVRCVPSPTFLPMEYADATCTESLIGGWDSSPIVAFASDQCPRQVTVFAVDEEYSGPIYRKDGEQCVFDREQPPQPSRTIAHRLGAEVPADSFPAMPITLR